MKHPRVTLRGGHYYLRKRVPTRYQPVDDRKRINICLYTDSKHIAERKAGEIWSQMIDAWEAKLDGHGMEGDERFEAARKLAHKRGYRFLDVERVARLPVDELLARVESTVNRNGSIDKQDADAALGLPKPPKIKVSEAFNEFYNVAADRTLGKSKDQLRRHKAPRMKATKNFIKAVGDLPIGDITTDDLFQFRAAWLERVARGEVSSESANKDFAYLTAMWRAVARAKSIQIHFDTRGLALREEKGRNRTRPPFSDEWIRDKILAPGALDSINTEARILILGMINTGYRPSEGAGLTGDRIRLDTDVPYIEIAPEGRTLKSGYSERTIPLTGISLSAFREHSTGFPRYADNPSLSATVNKFMRENGLTETPKHTFYSFRHAFEDRMLTAGIDERIRRDLLGHTLNRERYGRGGELKFIQSLLAPIAL